MQKKIETIDEYIALFPEKTQSILKKLRKTIKESAPGAEEVISYGMPAIKLNKRILVYFAAFKNHIGFFPTPSGIEAFKSELKDYTTTKGTIHFPYDKPIPYPLIKRIVKYRVNENMKKVL